MVFGYARVSTDAQNLQSQLDELESYHCEHIFQEKLTGANTNRPELQAMLEKLRKGDVVVVTRIDRLARSLKDLIFLLDKLASMEIVLKVARQHYDFTTPEGRLFAQLFGAVAEYERQLIKARTMEGLIAARKEGRIGGRPKGMSPQAQSKAKEIYELRKKDISIAQIQTLVEVKSKRTLYKYLRWYVQKLATEKGRKVSEDGLTLI